MLRGTCLTTSIIKWTPWHLHHECSSGATKNSIFLCVYMVVLCQTFFDNRLKGDATHTTKGSNLFWKHCKQSKEFTLKPGEIGNVNLKVWISTESFEIHFSCFPLVLFASFVKYILCSESDTNQNAHWNLIKYNRWAKLVSGVRVEYAPSSIRCLV